ncbi:MAG: ribonuclease HI [Clostridia bacterium]|nr:ribonuclease HI [Clostridia bacterium]
MKEVTIYTDGACSGNPGPGGYGAILIYGPHTKKIYGGEPLTTNNRMELRGPIEALKMLKEPCAVKLYSDSSYVVNTFTLGWLEDWEKKNFKGKANVDLVKELAALCRVHSVTWIKVKGHADNELNNECDSLATTYAGMISRGEASATDGSPVVYTGPDEA